MLLDLLIDPLLVCRTNARRASSLIVHSLGGREQLCFQRAAMAPFSISGGSPARRKIYQSHCTPFPLAQKMRGIIHQVILQKANYIQGFTKELGVRPSKKWTKRPHWGWGWAFSRICAERALPFGHPTRSGLRIGKPRQEERPKGVEEGGRMGGCFSPSML